MNSAWVFLAAIVATATSYEAGPRFAREYGAPGESPGARFASASNYNYPSAARSDYRKPVREGRYIPLPPGAKVYFAHPGIPRLFRDVDSAIAGLPDGNYKLFYTPARQ